MLLHKCYRTVAQMHYSLEKSYISKIRPLALLLPTTDKVDHTLHIQIQQ